jgi:hypothetical protein
MLPVALKVLAACLETHTPALTMRSHKGEAPPRTSEQPISLGAEVCSDLEHNRSLAEYRKGLWTHASARISIFAPSIFNCLQNSNIARIRCAMYSAYHCVCSNLNKVALAPVATLPYSALPFRLLASSPVRDAANQSPSQRLSQLPSYRSPRAQRRKPPFQLILEARTLSLEHRRILSRARGVRRRRSQEVEPSKKRMQIGRSHRTIFLRPILSQDHHPRLLRNIRVQLLAPPLQLSTERGLVPTVEFSIQ